MEETIIQVVGVLGDVHTEDAALHTALDFLRSRPRIDEIICTGDILGGEGSADRCCELLASAGVLSVRGNHDRWHFEAEPFHDEILALAQPEDLATWPVRLSESARDYLFSLPATRTFRTPHGELLLCHGLGDDDMAGVLADENHEVAEERLANSGIDPRHVRFVVNGHTHQRMVRQVGPVTIINAGTLLRHPEATFAIIDFKACMAEFFRIGPHEKVSRARTDRLQAADAFDNGE